METNLGGSRKRAGIPTYFRNATEEILRKILRFLLIGDTNNDVKRKVILEQNHPLRSAIKNAFRRLDLIGDAPSAVKCCLSEGFSENQIHHVSLGRNISNEELEQVLMATKNSIESVELSAIHHMSQDLRRMCQLVATHGKNITKLRIFDYQVFEVEENLNEALGTMICTLAPQLTFLSCEFIYDYVSLSALATSLDGQVTSLKQLSLVGDFLDLNVFEVFAKKCGEALEQLELGFDGIPEDEWRKVMDNIRKYCAKLTSLQLQEPTLAGVSENDYVSFLTSYGNQLVSIAPLRFSASAFQRLRQACPSLRLRVELGEDELDWHCLSDASDIISAAKMELYFHHNFRRLSNLLRECHNLVELEMRYISYEYVSALSSAICSPLYKVEKLILRRWPIHACLSIVEKCSSRLKHLSISMHEPINDAKPFPGIVAAAKNLESVFICDVPLREGSVLQYSETERDTVFIDIVRSFLKCKSLRCFCLSLHIPTLEAEVRAICLPFRIRGVYCGFSSEGKLLLRIEDNEYTGWEDSRVNEGTVHSDHTVEAVLWLAQCH